MDRQKIMREVVRSIFAVMFLIELLNLLNVTHFTLVYTSLGLIVTLGAVWAVMEIVDARRPLHQGVWIAAAAAIIIDAAGDFLHFYATIPHYDKYAHFTNSGLAAAAILFFGLWRRRAPRGWDYWIAWSSVTAIGALYELEEFWESVTRHNNRWGGGPDTLTDMTANALGALAAVLIAFITVRFFKYRGGGDRSA